MQSLKLNFQKVFFSNTELKYFKFILFIYCFELPDFPPPKKKIVCLRKEALIFFILHFFKTKIFSFIT